MYDEDFKPNRRPLIVGNWKMQKTLQEMQSFFEEWPAKRAEDETPEVDVGFALPFPYLSHWISQRSDRSMFSLYAQDVSSHKEGAYTGEVSAKMLNSLDVDGSLVGHSERRVYHQENEELLLEKIKRLHEENLKPIYCIGENGQERESGKTHLVLSNQLTPILNYIKSVQDKPFVIAYEPVWAIGTGVVASIAQVVEAHSYIRKIVSEIINFQYGYATHIIYGGSVKPDNCRELIQGAGVDGFLVGGASLQVSDFYKITQSQKQ